MNTIKIKQYQWNKKDYTILKKSCLEKFHLKESQIYQPYFSLYFYINNTKFSHSLFDLNRRFILKRF